MSSGRERFEAELLASGRRGTAEGASPRELAAGCGLSETEAAEVLRRWIERGWYQAAGALLDGSLTDSAPRRLPTFGSFATDGHWSEDRWGHRIFHPRRPGEPPAPTDEPDRRP